MATPPGRSPYRRENLVAWVLGILWAGVFVLFLTHYGDPGPWPYVMRDATGQVLVGHTACAADDLDRITVRESAPPHHVLWRIDRHGHPTTVRIPLGQVPPGYREAVPFHPPPPDAKIDIEVHDGDASGTITLTLRDLHPAHYLSTKSTLHPTADLPTCSHA